MKRIIPKNKLTVFQTLIALTFLNIKIFSQSGTITGPPEIVPGISTNYGWYTTDYCNTPNWSCTDPNVSFSSSSNVSSTSIIVSKNITAPSIQIKVSSNCEVGPGTQIYYTGSDIKDVMVNPFLTGPTIIYPGESITIYCQDNRSGYAGHNACVWDWSLNDMNSLFCPGGNCNNNISNSVVISCPTSLPATLINSGNYHITCNEKCGMGSYQYGSQMDISIKLHTPTITGLSAVGCGGDITNNLIYTASQVTGANYYVWQVPSGWSIISGSTTNQITVNTNGSNGGNITVRAYYSNGSAVKSDLSTFNVTCCATNLTITNDVSSGNTDHQQAATTIIASNIVNNGGTASYHAGHEMSLIPGFSSIPGSEFHAYIEGCNGIYLRMANESDNQDQESTSNNQELINEKITNNSRPSNDENNTITVYPNPNAGVLFIKSNASQKLKYKIYTIQNIFLKEGSVASDNKIIFEELNSGLYLLEIISENNSGKIFKIIKN